MRYVQHHFGVDMAARYGIPCAILAQEIFYWTTRNAAEGNNIHGGRAWMYQTVAALEKLHPYLTNKQIRGALGKLVEEGIVVKGKFNKNPYDHTVWYALTDFGLSWFTPDGYGFEACGEDSDEPDFYAEDEETAGRADLPSRANRISLQGKSNRPQGQNDSPVRANRIAPEGKSSISTINTHINTHIDAPIGARAGAYRPVSGRKKGKEPTGHDFSRYNYS